MFRHRIPAVHVTHPNVTPLIDVVMCLIVFFMLVAKIGVSTGAEKMDLPSTVLGTDIKDMSNTLTLNVRKGPLNLPLITALLKSPDTGQLKLQEIRLTDSAGRQPLLDTLKFFRKQSPEKFNVIIRGEAEMAYQYLEPVLISCANAGVKTVSFDTQKVEQKVPTP